MIAKKFTVNNQTFNFKADEDGIYLNDYMFDTIEDYIYFVNKLTDYADEAITEDMEGDK